MNNSSRILQIFIFLILQVFFKGRQDRRENSNVTVTTFKKMNSFYVLVYIHIRTTPLYNARQGAIIACYLCLSNFTQYYQHWFISCILGTDSIFVRFVFWLEKVIFLHESFFNILFTKIRRFVKSRILQFGS